MHVVLCIVIWLRSVVGSYYYHEPSLVIFRPDPLKEHNTFGFSMGYQNLSSTLVVGAPQSNLIGKVFQCHLNETFFNKINYCHDVDIDVDKLAPYNRDYTPNIKFNLGASIAATSDYFMTCAPLWTTTLEGLKNFSYGTCFTYNGTAHRYRGMVEKHQSDPGSVQPTNILYGGIGWKTLMDEVNEMLLVAKVSLIGDIVYMNSSNPLREAVSLVADSYREYYKNYQHIGYSMTTGNFFNKETVHIAVSSMTTTTAEGVVHFLYSKTSARQNNIKKLYMLEVPADNNRGGSFSSRKYVEITDDVVGSMFGADMGSADLNNDGLSELLVGAPAQDDQERGSETGALHIYMGGDMRTINEDSRHRIIVSSKDRSRFGSAIATSDVDGDNFPEIFVSAPYEGNGIGAVYILSGFEINEMVITKYKHKRIALATLKRTQKISREEFKTFGYSLQNIPDKNDNGCDELAIGAPGTNAIIMMRCIPSVNVTVSTVLVGAQIVKEQDNNFTIKVCISVKHLKGRNYTIDLKATNQVIGNGAQIEASQINKHWKVSGNKLEEIRCHDVLIKLNNVNEPGEYSFSTNIEMDEDKIKSNNEFNSRWAMISPQSSLESSIEVSRHCTGKDCDPDLTVNISWPFSEGYYQLDSSESLSPSLNILNRGNSSFDACLYVRVSGAPVLEIDCGDHIDGYKCYMPKPLKRNDMHELPITFNMRQPSTQHKKLRIQVSLFEFCNQPNGTSKDFDWILPYKVDINQIFVKSLGHNRTVSDVEIQELKAETINDAHEYWVINKGSVTWRNLTVIVKIDKKPFIQSYDVSSYDCKQFSNLLSVIFNCTLQLMPHSTVKVIATSRISKSKIMENLEDGKLEVSSSLTVSVDYSTISDKKTNYGLSTAITLQKEMSLGQNKQLIIFLAILGALIALSVFIYVLYKFDFFKRNEKTKLEFLKKEHSMRQNMKRSTSEGTPTADDIDMEVEDDSPFEIVDMTDPVLKQDTKL